MTGERECITGSPKRATIRNRFGIACRPKTYYYKKGDVAIITVHTLFDALAHWAEVTPDKTALLDVRGAITYRGYAAAVERFRSELAALAEVRGRAVAIALPKCASLPVAYLGAAAAGALPFPVDYKNGLGPIKTALQSLGGAAVVIAAESGLAPEELKATLNVPVAAIDAYPPDQEGASFTPPAEARPATPFYLNVTSGVTGRPQAVVATHGNVIANAAAACARFNLTEQDVHLCAFAAHSHPHETFTRALLTGGTAAFAETLLPRSLLAAVERWRVTALMGVPPLYRSLLDAPIRADVSSVRLAEAGGMLTTGALMRDFSEAWRIPLARVWGSTETSGIAFVADADDPEGSLGRPLPIYDVTLRDDSGREVPPGEPGELYLEGPACPRAWWRFGKPEPMPPGPIRISDVLRREKDGTYSFVDRANGMMKIAGEKVYAAEIERVLLQHPQITEAAVVSAPDDVRGEVAHAYVVPYDAVDLDVADVKRFVRTHLPPVKRPRRVVVVADLPRAGNYKVDKSKLAAGSDELTALDRDLLRLLNERMEILRRVGRLKSLEGQRLRLERLKRSNAGSLHNETVELIFKTLDELMSP